MATKNMENERENITGLDSASDRKAAEYDLVTSLLEAAEFKTADESITEVKVTRNGKFLFSVHMHPVSEPDTRFARKKATTYMPNPNGKKYPPIEKEFDSAKFNAWLIYLATTEEDQAKIWGNPAIMQKFGLAQPVESIDILLTVGDKRKLADIVTDISGLDDEEEERDAESFQSESN